jgi:hypothetical protein
MSARSTTGRAGRRERRAPSIHVRSRRVRREASPPLAAELVTRALPGGLMSGRAIHELGAVGRCWCVVAQPDTRVRARRVRSPGEAGV